MNESRLIPFSLFWKNFRNEFPALNLNKRWFTPKSDAHGFIIEIPEYISNKLPSKFKLKLEEEEKKCNNECGTTIVESQNESKLQWFPNTERNYQSYSQTEKTQCELLSVFSFEQMLNAGKLSKNDLKDLPLFKIHVITTYMNHNHMEEDKTDDDDDSKDIELNRESQSYKDGINQKKESMEMFDEEDDEYDFIMKDNQVEVEEITNKSKQHQVKIIDLNDIEEMAKKHGIAFKN